MPEEIRIDIIRHYDRHGKKPAGRGYWLFRMVSPRATAKDHTYAPQEEMEFNAACARVLDIAAMRKATRILLLPE